MEAPADDPRGEHDASEALAVGELPVVRRRHSAADQGRPVCGIIHVSTVICISPNVTPLYDKAHE